MDGFTPELLLLFAVLGAAAGFLAGMLGIGGGVILVPLFLKVFPLIGFPPQTLVHLALGTSLAVILPTAISSSIGHLRRDNIAWDMVRFLAAGALVGALLGSWAASLLSGEALKACFGLVLTGVGLQFLLFRPNYQPVADRARPLAARLLLVGLCGGFFSAFFGIGGGIVAVPLLLVVLRLPIHQAVGNSSVLMVVSALAGALSYMLHGWGQPGLPPYSTGYISAPVAAAVSLTATTCARLGVRVASRLRRDTLTNTFACLLILIGLRLVWQSLS